MRHLVRYLCIALAVCGISVVVIFASRVYQLWAYAQEREAGYAIVSQLSSRRPAEVDPAVWTLASDWAVTAYSNTCFSSGYVDIDELKRFRVDAENRLKGKVDLASVDWLWQRLGETGPHGKQYQKRFQPQYHEQLEAALKLVKK